jgi:hypothetical protein
MKLINGLLQYHKPWKLPNVYIFTGNPIIKNNGTIVMGRGAAKQVRDSYPGIDRDIARAITRTPTRHVIWHAIAKSQWVGWFKVKDHWADPARMTIIVESVKQLRMVVEEFPDHIFHMNYPGIGNGKLPIEAVERAISVLPDNVWVYR